LGFGVLGMGGVDGEGADGEGVGVDEEALLEAVDGLSASAFDL